MRMDMQFLTVTFTPGIHIFTKSIMPFGLKVLLRRNSHWSNVFSSTIQLFLGILVCECVCIDGPINQLRIIPSPRINVLYRVHVYKYKAERENELTQRTHFQITNLEIFHIS